MLAGRPISRTMSIWHWFGFATVSLAVTSAVVAAGLSKILGVIGKQVGELLDEPWTSAPPTRARNL